MTGDIFVYGGIGTGPGEVSFDSVNDQIEQNQAADELILHIISPGGDVFEGEAIYNALKNSGKKVTTQVEGTCASIATLIAGAGDKIIMNRTARWMIHNPKISGLNGMADSRDLRKVAVQLDQIKTLLIDVYDIKTDLGKDKLWELYDNETWLTAQDAQKMGFVDEVQDAIKAVATINLNHFKMEKDKSLWTKVQNLFKLTKFKNDFTEALEDGTVIIVMAETEDWTGAQVIREDGSTLEAGDYTLQTGKIITVDESSVITVITDPEAQLNKPLQQPDTIMEEKIKELEALLSEAKAAQQVAETGIQTAETAATEANAKATAAEAQSTKFSARLEAIEKQFLALQEASLVTVGDTKELAKGPTNKLTTEHSSDPMLDAMAEQLGQAYVSSRPSNTYLKK